MEDKTKKICLIAVTAALVTALALTPMVVGKGVERGVAAAAENFRPQIEQLLIDGVSDLKGQIAAKIAARLDDNLPDLQDPETLKAVTEALTQAATQSFGELTLSREELMELVGQVLREKMGL